MPIKCGTYYNRTNTCDVCKKKLIDGARREKDKNDNLTGRWICKNCYYFQWRYGTTNKDEIKHIPGYGQKGNSKYYNKTNTCDNIKEDGRKCENKLECAYREYNKEGNWTGKLVCKNCYIKDYEKNNPNSHNNTIKEMRDFRLKNLDPYSETGKGYIYQQVTCKARRITDLNLENDNFQSPIDHSADHQLGIVQTKDAILNIENRLWSFSNQTEQGKIFNNLIIYCLSIDMKNIEKAYIIPWEEIIIRLGFSISKNASGYHWYDKYIVDEINI